MSDRSNNKKVILTNYFSKVLLRVKSGAQHFDFHRRTQNAFDVFLQILGADNLCNVKRLGIIAHFKLGVCKATTHVSLGLSR